MCRLFLEEKPLQRPVDMVERDLSEEEFLPAFHE
jgi:hypothetical protein